MAGVELTLTLDDGHLHQMLASLKDFNRRAMMGEMGEYLVSRVVSRLESQTDVRGKALEPSRRAQADGGKTLIDKGQLRDSYTYQVFADGSGVEVGSDLIYAAIHHFGGETGRRRSRASLRSRHTAHPVHNHAVTLPARPVLGINEDDEQEIDVIVFNAIQRQLEQAARA